MERKSLKILIDARMIFGRIHGIARYLAESLKIFRDSGVPHEILLLSNNPDALKKLDLTPPFQVVPVKSRPFSIGEFTEIPSAIKKSGADLYYAPSISVPVWKIIPTVITVPDLIPMHQGGMFHKIYCKTVLRNAVNYSEKILTISSFIKDEIINYLGGKPEKIRVTYLAADRPPEKKISWGEIRDKFSLKKPYLFCLANPKPHKNLSGLIDIFTLVKENFRDELYLVIGSKSSEPLEKKIADSPYTDCIKRIDYFEDNELDAIYSNTSIFVFTSYFEGFGLPPLEAFARGIPVVSSDRASLPEVVGEAGILCDPDDKQAFARHVISLLQDGDKYVEFSKKGLDQSQKFSYEKYSREIMGTFEEVMKGS